MADIDTTSITNAMSELSNYIGTKSENSRILVIASKNTETRDRGLTDAADSFTKITNKGSFDYTSILYQLAHMPGKYDGYYDNINFVDVIRDKMSNLNQAIYTNILVNDSRYKNDCFCAKKNQDRGITYEGIMESKLYGNKQQQAYGSNPKYNAPNDDDDFSPVAGETPSGRPLEGQLVDLY
jgi:hypothetical protein